jgi:hypothetical protein
MYILNEFIITEYKLGPSNLMNYDRQFFRHPLATMLQKKDERSKLQWLKPVDLARQGTDLLQQQARNALYWESNLIENWLGVGQSPV